MPKRVPVADSLLTTKFKGFSVKRLLQSFAIPLGPGAVALLLNLPIEIYAPLGIVGFVAGGLVFMKTPTSQRPHQWLLGMLRLRFTDATYHWQPTHPESNTVTYQSYFQSTDEEKTQTEEAETEETEETQIERILGSDNTADHLDFEYIREDGVIVTEENVSMMIEISPRPWLILDTDQKEAVLEAWSDILMGTQSTFQILTLPTPYDASAYTRRLEKANERRAPDENPLLSHGRNQHRHWVNNVVDMADIRDRRHFVVVTVAKSMAENDEEKRGLLGRFRRSGGDDEVDMDILAQEVHSRAENMASSLPPTGVDPEILDDPDDIKQVLYYYYKGEEPPETLEHGWLTKHATPDGVETGSAQRPTQTQTTHQTTE